MTRTTWRRPVMRLLAVLGGAVLLLWAAATLAFAALRLVPGDPVEVMLGPQAQVSQDVKDALRTELGLDRPLWEQYLSYLGQLVRGDLGESFQLRMPVVEVIGRQVAPTLQLTALALAFALVLVVVGVILARGPRSRSTLAAIELVVLSAPVFGIGLVLLAVFAFALGWFPVAGSRGFAALVLPAITLALPCAALLGQVLHDGLDEAGRQPFTLTARARGASPERVLTRHTLRHASIGTLTMTAYLVGSLLGGAVLVETVFARPGLGRVALTAILDRDLPVVAGVILLSAAVFAIVNLLVDLAAPLLDPRLRRSGVLR